MRIIYSSVTFFLVFLLQSLPGFGQYLQYQKVIEAPGLKPSEIIERANRWALSAYNSYQDVLQYKDTTNLVLSGVVSATSNGGSGMSFVVVNKTYKYNFNLESKPGRCRVTISNFRDTNPKVAESTLRTKESLLKEISESEEMKDRMKKNVIASLDREFKQIDFQINGLLVGLQESLLKKDDW